MNKALGVVIKTGLKLAGPIIRGLKGISGKVKAKVAAGKAWVKGKVEAGKKWAKGKVAAGKQWVKGGETSNWGRQGQAEEFDGEGRIAPSCDDSIDFAGAGHVIKMTPSAAGVAVTITIRARTSPHEAVLERLQLGRQFQALHVNHQGP